MITNNVILLNHIVTQIETQQTWNWLTEMVLSALLKDVVIQNIYGMFMVNFKILSEFPEKYFMFTGIYLAVFCFNTVPLTHSVKHQWASLRWGSWFISFFLFTITMCRFGFVCFLRRVFHDRNAKTIQISVLGCLILTQNF